MRKKKQTVTQTLRSPSTQTSRSVSRSHPGLTRSHPGLRDLRIHTDIHISLYSVLPFSFHDTIILYPLKRTTKSHDDYEGSPTLPERFCRSLNSLQFVQCHVVVSLSSLRCAKYCSLFRKKYNFILLQFQCFSFFRSRMSRIHDLPYFV